jgi:hypothetical protein
LQAEGEDGECAMILLRQPVTGRTLLHLAALADGRLPRLLTTTVPGFAAQANTADAAGGTPLEAACAGFRRAEGLLHLVRCGAQVYDDSGVLLAAALPTSASAHDRCVLLDAFAAEGAVVRLAPRADRVPVHAETNAVMGPLRHLLMPHMDPTLLRRLVPWAPGCLEAWVATCKSQCGDARRFWASSAGYLVAEVLHRAPMEAVRGGVAPLYDLPRPDAPGRTVTWMRHAVPQLHPTLLRELAWTRRGPVVALRLRLRVIQDTEPTTTNATRPKPLPRRPAGLIAEVASFAAGRDNNTDGGGGAARQPAHSQPAGRPTLQRDDDHSIFRLVHCSTTA